ncbi:MAG: hypothetical protein WDW36_001370 [Sanguina aurantia]
MAVVVRPFQHQFPPGLKNEEDFNMDDGGIHVCIGDVIDTGDQADFLRGHGTHVVNGQLVATVCGVVQRVNKLITVAALRSRYKAQQGDVVVGRVTEVAGKRWRIDINSSQEAHLLLSAVNLPGGIQRRRNAEDELNMRELFKEQDLISAEVQSVHGDGSVSLHTRSVKYGKLIGGHALKVPHNLVKRQKQHFVSLAEQGVDLILGVNGLLWVAPHHTKPVSEDGRPEEPAPEAVAAAAASQPCSVLECRAVSRASRALRSLADSNQPIFPAAVKQECLLIDSADVTASS